MGKRNNEIDLGQLEKQLIESISNSPWLKQYKKKEILSQIFLEQDFGSLLTLPDIQAPPNPVITITELEDRVEVFRYNLDYNPVRLFLDLLGLMGLGPYPKRAVKEVTYSGIMSKKSYDNLFGFLEQKGVWEMQAHINEFDSSPHSLLISRNQRKHAFTMDPIYNMVYLYPILHLHAKYGLKEAVSKLTPEEGSNTSRFLDISKEIYKKSKKYTRVKS